MNKFLKGIINKYKLEELLSHNLTKKTIQVFLIQCLGILLVLISNFWIAKLLTVSGYGQFSFIMTVINLLSAFACLGFTGFLIKNIGEYSVQKKYGEIKGLMRFSYQVSSIGALLLFSGLAVASRYDLLPLQFDNRMLLNVGISIFASTLLLVRQFTLQSLNHTTESRVINNVIRYSITIFLIFIYVQALSSSMDTGQIVFINTISLVVSLVLIELVTQKVTSSEIKNSKPVFHSTIWLKSAFILFTYKLMFTYLISSEILLLGFLRDEAEVGIYSIARKISGFVSFGQSSANIVLAPLVARLFAESNLSSLQRMLRKSTRLVFVFSILVTVILVIGSFPLFSFLGEEYKHAYLPLLIMIAGELINVAYGPVGNLLINSGQEKYGNLCIFITVVFNIICNLVLIYFYGYIGAAITSTLSVILWNSLMAYGVKKKIGIKSGIW